jgi:mono/diheme cytochrome c family protein
MKWINNNSRTIRLLSVCAVLLAFSGCYKWDMMDQAKQKPLSESPMFKDGRSSRLPVEGTVARGQLNDDEQFYTGKLKGSFATTFPFPVTQQILDLGEERFNIYCSVCHDKTGSGKGIVVQRGFNPPTSFHIPRLRDESPGYFFDVMTNGYRTMPAYAFQVSPKERWAIAAYIRALQLSQNVPAKVLTSEEREELDKPQSRGESKDSGEESGHAR